MLRSPFFYFIILLFLFSCKEKKTIKLDIESIRKEALSLRDKADENYQKQNLNTAFYEFNKSKLLFEKLKDSANISYVLIQIAVLQQTNGDYYGSKETVTEALPYATNENHIGVITNLLGISDKELSLYNDAIFYYKEAVKIYKSLNEKQDPLNNIAAVYIQQKKYDKAIIILEFLLESPSSKKILTEKTQANKKARFQDNLGYAYFKKGMEEKGFHLMSEGLQLRKENNDNYGSI